MTTSSTEIATRDVANAAVTTDWGPLEGAPSVRDPG